MDNFEDQDTKEIGSTVKEPMDITHAPQKKSELNFPPNLNHTKHRLNICIPSPVKKAKITVTRAEKQEKGYQSASLTPIYKLPNNYTHTEGREPKFFQINHWRAITTRAWTVTYCGTEADSIPSG